MAGFKVPDFAERAAAARAAKQRALDRLSTKPAPDAATIAARQASRAAREAAAAERRAARQALANEAKAAKAAKSEQPGEPDNVEGVAATPTEDRPPPTEAELKAARDARYAARKARKR